MNTVKNLRSGGVRLARATTLSTLTAATLIGGTQIVLGTMAVAKNVPMVTTTAVNVRVAPGTTSSIIDVARSGSAIVATGPSANGWTPVLFNGRKAWISSAYLVSSLRSTPMTATTSSASAVTTEALNVRKGPSTSTSVVTVLSKGAAVSLTGTTSGNWLQITMGGRTLWVSGSYISRSSAPTTTVALPKATGQARATADLMIRTAPGMSFTNLGDIPAGTVLSLTGPVQGNTSQVIWDGALRWVNNRYLAAVASSTPQVQAPTAPKVTGYRYATAALNIRTAPTGDATLLEVPAGTKLAVTGTNSNGRAQVVYQGAVRWVTAAYISVTPVGSQIVPSTTAPARTLTTTTGSLNTGGSSGLDSLTSTAKGIVYTSRANFPQIRTIYGVRSDSLPDHPSGHAVDLMLPNYRSNEALGWQVAKYLQANASELNISYIIFHQHIWSVARSGEGWRMMANRGGDTANHYDHVHVSVR